MSQRDPVLAALRELPLAEVSPELSARIRRGAHARLRRAAATSRPRKRWLDSAADAVALAITIAHASWALTFVSGLYR